MEKDMGKVGLGGVYGKGHLGKGVGQGEGIRSQQRMAGQLVVNISTIKLPISMSVKWVKATTFYFYKDLSSKSAKISPNPSNCSQLKSA